MLRLMATMVVLYEAVYGGVSGLSHHNFSVHFGRSSAFVDHRLLPD